jgi:hypothetical protein
MLAVWRVRDPCAAYYLGRALAAIQHPQAMEMMRRVVDGGYHPTALLRSDPWLDPLRSEPAFNEIVKIAEAGRRDAERTFLESGGERVLGPLH